MKTTPLNMSIKGALCNGVNSFQRKSGESVLELLIQPPFADGLKVVFDPARAVELKPFDGQMVDIDCCVELTENHFGQKFAVFGQTVKVAK